MSLAVPSLSLACAMKPGDAPRGVCRAAVSEQRDPRPQRIRHEPHAIQQGDQDEGHQGNHGTTKHGAQLQVLAAQAKALQSRVRGGA